MKQIIVLLIVCAIGWQAYGKYQQRAKQSFIEETQIADRRSDRNPAPIHLSVSEQRIATPTANNNFHCDGRIHCTQMTSCEEATWFLRNCPGTKMDGDNDGIPCERGPC